MIPKISQQSAAAVLWHLVDIDSVEFSSNCDRACLTLLATGVVSGEFGLADAYSRKAELVADWQSDPDPHVRKFARSFSESLNAMAERERENALESMEVRKHLYGVRNTTKATQTPRLRTIKKAHPEHERSRTGDRVCNPGHPAPDIRSVG